MHDLRRGLITFAASTFGVIGVLVVAASLVGRFAPAPADVAGASGRASLASLPVVALEVLDIGVDATLTVRSLVAGSRAEEAGLRLGDRVVAVEGDRVSTVDGLRQALRGVAAAEAFEVTVARGRMEVALTVGARSLVSPLERVPARRGPPRRRCSR
jgi:S1-C subfamily serine protease